MDVSKPCRTVTPLAPEQTEYLRLLLFCPVAGTSEPVKRILDNIGVKTALKPVQKIGNLFPNLKT